MYMVCPANKSVQPDAITLAGRSSVAVVMLLLTKVGKMPDPSDETPSPPFDPPSKVSEAPVPCTDEPGEVPWTAAATTLPVVETAAVEMLVESPVLRAVLLGGPASKGTMADSAAAFSAAAAAAFASDLASALARFRSSSSFSRRCFTASSSWGALRARGVGR